MPDVKLHWPNAPAELRLAENDVHVFSVSLSLSSAELEKRAASLSSAEKERAAKFKFDKHRNRFIAGRGSLRGLLGGYLQTDPAKLDFTYSERGKPILAAPFANSGIHFNLTHSEDLALIAVTRAAPVGIDVEFTRPLKNGDDLVARFFSPRENELFKKISETDKPAAFFNLWTRKEALLKATGEGIGSALNRVEVSFLANEPARLLAIDGDSEKAAQWYLRELSPVSGFVGAIATLAQSVRILTYDAFRA
jgi:4'-phosphopantetheinyl transferase